MSELRKDFDVTQVPYHKRYQTIDGIRWVMLEEANREIESRQLESPWVSVQADGLPKTKGKVLVETINQATFEQGGIALLYFDPAATNSCGPEYFKRVVKRWMSFPMPWEVETDE